MTFLTITDEKKPDKRMSIVSFDESVKGQRFILLLDTNNASLCCSTNNAFRIVAQTDFNSDNTIDFCVVKVFMTLLETKKEFLKLTKCLRVRNEYRPTNNASFCCWKQTTLPLLLETNNAFRIVSQTHAQILMFIVFVSSGDLTLVFG